MHVKRGTHFVTCGRSVNFSMRKRKQSQEMDLCSMMGVSLNAKVHGVLMMLSLTKPVEKFHTTTGIFVLYHVSHHLLQLLSIAAVPHANAHGCDTNLITFL